MSHIFSIPPSPSFSQNDTLHNTTPHPLVAYHTTLHEHTTELQKTNTTLCIMFQILFLNFNSCVLMVMSVTIKMNRVLIFHELRFRYATKNTINI